MSSARERLLKRLPWAIQRWLHRVRERRTDRLREQRAPADLFGAVYRSGRWGGAADVPFYSGLGSHDEAIVGTYVRAVTAFLASLDRAPDVVDLGCGDFNVGRRVRPACGRYIACDVVPALIEHNRAAFGDLGVDFRCLDATADPLPPGEVIFLRQVLQHLGNAQIGRIVEKLGGFRYLVVTEHLPGRRDFVPNLDKSAGDDVRAGRVEPSGVVLTAPPFNLKPRRTTQLCEVVFPGGIIQTLLHEL